MLVLMTAGVIVGFLINKSTELIKKVDKLITWAIYLLLFLLGIAVGVNDKIINNLDTIGLSALIISLGAILGSVLFAWVIYHFFFIPKQKGGQANEK